MNTILDFTEGAITVNQGETTATISGATSEFFDVGTALFTEGNLPVSATRGNDTNEIILARPWPYDSVSSEPFVAFNTIEGLVRALRDARQASDLLTGVLSSLEDVLTSTDPEVIIETIGGDLNVTPWGFIQQQIESEWQDIQDNVASQNATVSYLALSALAISGGA